MFREPGQRHHARDTNTALYWSAAVRRKAEQGGVSQMVLIAAGVNGVNGGDGDVDGGDGSLRGAVGSAHGPRTG